MVEILSYGPQWEEAHTTFAKKYWPKKKRRSSPEYIYWKYRGEKGKTLQNFLVAVHDNKVVGQFGVIPVNLNLKGKIIESQWAVDLMVDDDYRGHGIAAKLYAAAHELKAITLGSDPSPAAAISMGRVGYKPLQSCFKYVVPIKLNEILKLKGYSVPILDHLSHPLILFKRLQSRKSYAFKKISANRYNKLIEQKVSDEFAVRVERDESFIQWRFSQFQTYYPGVECFQMNDDLFFCGYRAKSQYVLCDHYASSVKQFKKILYFILGQHLDSTLKRIRFFSNFEDLNLGLSLNGLIKFRTQTTVIYKTDDPTIEQLMANNKFYYTLLDSDENI